MWPGGVSTDENPVFLVGETLETKTEPVPVRVRGGKNRPCRFDLCSDFQGDESLFPSEKYYPDLVEAIVAGIVDLTEIDINKVRIVVKAIVESTETDLDPNLDDVLKVVQTIAPGVEIDFDEVLIVLHRTRRINHRLCVRWGQYSLVPLLHGPKSVLAQKCSVDKKCLMFSCPKGATSKAKKCGKMVRISSIITQVRILAYQAAKLGSPYSVELDNLVSQLEAGQWTAMHTLAPECVTMCPGTCKDAAGMFVPATTPVSRSKCGDVRCHACPIVTQHVPTRVMTCRNGCKKEDGGPENWCVVCGEDHPHDADCNPRAMWDKLPTDLRKVLREKVKQKLAQFCPKCHRCIEKSEGCDKMTCPCGCKFCLKCGELLGGDYVTNHLFPVLGGMNASDLVCRLTVVRQAFAGDVSSLAEVVAAMESGHRRVGQDVTAIAQEVEPSTIPVELLPFLQLGGGGAGGGGAGGAGGQLGQMEMDELLAAHMWVADLE